jgi:hypothetical protein
VTEGAAPSREIVRSAPRRTSDVLLFPGADDLHQSSGYGRELLISLMRAQAGATLTVLLPAVALLALYPLLAVLVPSLAGADVWGVPLTLVVLGGGIYPPLVLLGFWYVRRAARLEQRFVDLLKER